MNSILQCLFSLSSIRARYYLKEDVKQLEHKLNRYRPSQCYLTQMYKLADGLLSGTFNPQPSESILKLLEESSEQEQEQEQSADPQQQKQLEELKCSIAPRMFKKQLAKIMPILKVINNKMPWNIFDF